MNSAHMAVGLCIAALLILIPAGLLAYCLLHGAEPFPSAMSALALVAGLRLRGKVIAWARAKSQVTAGAG